MSEKTKNVLHIEDESSICTLIKNALECVAGINLTQKMNFSEGFKEALSGRYELIISDGTLPDGHGTAILKAVSESYPATRTMLVSADNDFVSDPEGYALKHPYITAFLSKPFSVPDLIEKVEALLHEQPITP